MHNKASYTILLLIGFRDPEVVDIQVQENVDNASSLYYVNTNNI